MVFMEIAKYRLINQNVAMPDVKTVKEIVAHLGAVQAQDYNMAKWAIGLRLSNSTEETIEEAIDRGDIIRTHILRPTWHFISSSDVRWMMELTAPHLKKILGSLSRKQELDEKTFNRSNAILSSSLQGGRFMTRKEIKNELEKQGIATNDLRAELLLFRAELDMIICNGPRRGKHFTYALFDERVPKSKSIARDAALAELSRRYFMSHGPATIKDFAWWSGLPIKDVRAGLEMVKPLLTCITVNSQDYWFSASFNVPENYFREIHYLPSFDELTVGYKDRSAIIDPQSNGHVMPASVVLSPIILNNFRISGYWKRSIKKDVVEIENNFFSGYPSKPDFSKAIERFENFFGKKVIVKENVNYAS